MYTVVNRHYYRRDEDGMLFTNKSPEFALYVAYCESSGLIPALEDSDTYELVEGRYNNWKYYRAKVKAAKLPERRANLIKNLYIERGELINNLCQSVLKYVTGLNDSTITDPAIIDAMVATHGNILSLLSVNRHTSAKALIDAIVPDQYITAESIAYINELYASYTAKINAVDARITEIGAA